MRSVHLFVCCLVFIPNLVFAEARSIRDHIYSPDLMSAEQEIIVETPSGLNKSTLTTPYAGDTLVTDKKRSIVLLDSKEKLSDLATPLYSKILKIIKGAKNIKNYYIFANFVHSVVSTSDETDFYIALIPKTTQVKRLLFQIEWFGMGAGAHNQIRMILDQAIILIPQQAEVYTELIIPGDLIYSLQTIRVETAEQNWAPLKGIMGEYANTLQFYSTQSKAKLQISQSVVKSYEFINLNAKQKKNIFTQALKISDQAQETEIFNTVFNNCVTHALKALKVALPGINEYHYNPYTVLDHVSKQTNGKLREVPTMNREFAEIATQPVLTMADIKSTELYKRVEPYLPLVREKAFDDVIRIIATFIINQKITYLEVKTAATRIKSGKSLKGLAQIDEGKRLIKMITERWKQAYPDQDLGDFFKSLEAMRTQNL